MLRVRPITWICVVLVLALVGWIGVHLISAARGTKSAGPSQEAQVYLPFVSKPCICYYVDSINGSDTNPGTSEDMPWRTLGPIHAVEFQPGSRVHFKRGSSWTGGLTIDNSGVQGNPIVFTTYGVGDKPLITNPGHADNWTRAVTINADWVVVEGLLMREAYYAGVYISDDSNHNVIRDLEVSNVGMGIAVDGQHNLITRNYVHDLHMVRNTPGGNDDFGAIGVTLRNSYNEVSYNTLVNCKAPSYDYGLDGGAVEWFGISDGNYVHHNWASTNNGFLEVGGGSARDGTVAYNISVNNGGFSYIHLDGLFASQVENFRVENNTIVEGINDPGGWVIFGFGGDPSPNTFLVRNSILYVDAFSAVSNKPSFTHNYNLYYLSGGTALGFALSQGEQVGAPAFVDLIGQDFHLQPSSPAIDAGTELGYTLDYEDNPVPAAIAPDLGALEYQNPP